MDLQDINLETWQVVLLIVAAVWELTWKGFALWRAARKGQSVWFFLLLVLNTVGIFPIIYLLVTNSSDEADDHGEGSQGI